VATSACKIRVAHQTARPEMVWIARVVGDNVRNASSGI
jgi:hypothetical protein